MRLLTSAYSCGPHRGSEPGVAWNIIRQLSLHHEVWVLTRYKNQCAIEAEAQKQKLRIHVIPVDLPWLFRVFKKGQLGLELYYYLWQLRAYLKARRALKQHNFQLTHHITFVRYWSPSFLALLPIPFIWGPVGGGESCPDALRSTLTLRGRVYEMLRDLARWAGERDPFVRMTARRALITFATTTDTARRLAGLGCRNVQIMSQVALSETELGALSDRACPYPEPMLILCVGRLLAWKGFHLAIEAFARADIPGAELYIVGNGPERNQLKEQARKLGLRQRVRFLGELPRQEVLELIGRCSALLHPSLHDSGGYVCAEAMAAKRPVICLATGGPEHIVGATGGISIPPHSTTEVVASLAAALTFLVHNPDVHRSMGSDASNQAKKTLTWSVKARIIEEAYCLAVGPLNASAAAEC